MRRVNYKHLQYFHAVASEGSIQAAAERLFITPQTISGQLKLLEEELGNELFTKSGRGLELTDAGRVAWDYSRQIFQLGDELQEVMHLGISNRPTEFRVGIVDALPKSLAHRFLSPAMTLPGGMRIICHEEQMTSLLGELAVHKLDLVLADSPIPPGMNIRCFNHLLGRSSLSCFAAQSLLSQTGEQRPFPACLDNSPVLLPTDKTSSLRTELMSWFNHAGLNVRVAGEFDDSALMKAFGSQGYGYFFAPSLIREEICEKYQVQWIGNLEDLVQEFYAISAQRQITHQGVLAITNPNR